MGWRISLNYLEPSTLVVLLRLGCLGAWKRGGWVFSKSSAGLFAFINLGVQTKFIYNYFITHKFLNGFWTILSIIIWFSVSAGNTTGFLQVFLEGGLNQQRIAVSNKICYVSWSLSYKNSYILFFIRFQSWWLQICDAVAVATLLGVTLVLPQFDVNPFWQDSRYGIFMKRWFILILD